MTKTLSTAQLEAFHEQGYLVVEDVLSPELDLDPVAEEYERLLDSLCTEWYREGALSSTFRGLPFSSRLQEVVKETGNRYAQHFDISLPQPDTMPPDTPMHTGPQVFNLLRSPRLLDVVEQLIGPEIYCNPVQHVRIKVPESLLNDSSRNALTSVTPWHQDQGVLLPEADDSDILTVWLPVTEATVSNGCLAVLPGSHRGNFLEHCPNGKYIPDELFAKPALVPLPMRKGSVLFMHRLTLHGSLPNQSSEIRWSFDLRYNRIGVPTGRPQFPGFVARSAEAPESVLRDHEAWAALWADARRELSIIQTQYHRWKDGSPVCA